MTRSKPDTSNDAVLYLRVSTQEQAREGISLAAQEAKLRAYCDLRGLQIVNKAPYGRTRRGDIGGPVHVPI